MRLVFPPALAIPIFSILDLGFNSLLPPFISNAAEAGMVFGYVLYDLIHYYLHHANPGLGYFKQLKTYHLNHHYKNYHLGYGISSKLWDVVFSTELK